MNPQLQVGSECSEIRENLNTFDPQLTEQLKEEGYAQFDSILDLREVSMLREGIERLAEKNLSPPFIAVYDEFWQLFRKASTLLHPILGEDCQMIPAFWAWQIAADSAGWTPHRDRGSNTFHNDGLPNAMTVWIALSEATPLNGCIYVLPANRDPNYRKFVSEDLTDLNLQDIRALSAPAGSILMWDQQLLHWGGTASLRADSPRVSVAFEFQRSTVPAFHEPLIDPASPPAFADRLKLIVQQSVRYRTK